VAEPAREVAASSTGRASRSSLLDFSRWSSLSFSRGRNGPRMACTWSSWTHRPAKLEGVLERQLPRCCSRDTGLKRGSLRNGSEVVLVRDLHGERSKQRQRPAFDHFIS